MLRDMTKLLVASFSFLGVVAFSGCGSNASTSGAAVNGRVSFVQGGSAVAALSATMLRGSSPARSFELSPKRLTSGDDYFISPNQAKITFTSIIFRDASGGTLGTSSLSGCVVTYDRSQASGTSLLDCPVAIPVGEIAQISVAFSKTIQILINDTTTGIYTNSAAGTGYQTEAPGGGPDFVDFHVTAGADPNERSTPVIFAQPITITADSSPQLYITTDMIHGMTLKVDAGGTTLSVPTMGTSDPVALFGGLTPGKSLFLSQATTIESVKVAGQKSVRIFYDESGQPLYLIGYTCGVDGPKGAWASPPIGATIGGWLGKDSANTIAWALPTDTSYQTYSAYFSMAEQTVLGGTTTLYCKASASPPVPSDSRTYASGAPTIESPTTSTVLNLLAM